jgi:hypothetical protein
MEVAITTVQEQRVSATEAQREVRRAQERIWARASYARRREAFAARVTPTTGTKRCPVCAQEKPVTDYYRQARAGDGLAYSCKQCEAIRKHAYYLTHREADAQRRRAWHLAHPERVREYRRRHELRRRYGITPEEYDRLLSEQRGLCALCGRAGNPDVALHPLDVDHDHTTGHVRGLLCTTCNTGLGMLGDTPEAIQRALAYVQG